MKKKKPKQNPVSGDWRLIFMFGGPLAFLGGHPQMTFLLDTILHPKMIFNAA